MDEKRNKVYFDPHAGSEIMSKWDVLFKDTTLHSLRRISRFKEEVIKNRIFDLTGIEIDLQEEQKRRFKRFVSEIKGNEETIYYNDGSIEGKRIVTFVGKLNPIFYNGTTASLTEELSYY